MKRTIRAEDWSDTDNVIQLLEQPYTPVPVMTNGFDTRTFAAQDQFAVWREAGTNIGIIDRPGAEVAPFRAAVRNYYTSTLAYSRHRAFDPSSLDRGDRHTAAVEVEAFAIQYRVSGTETANGFGTGRYFTGGDIRIVDLSRPLFSVNPTYDNIAVIVRKRDLVDRVPALDRLHGATLPAGGMTALLRAHMVSAIDGLPTLSQREADKLSDVTVEMLGAALSSATIPGIMEAEELDAPLLKAVRLCIEQHLHRPALSPDFIAHAVGVSRAKLFRVCRPFGRPMELVRHKRLQRAMALIRAARTGGRPATVTEIAYMVGFENRETFSRAFKAEFGLSARDALQLHLAQARTHPAHPAHPAHPDPAG